MTSQRNLLQLSSVCKLLCLAAARVLEASAGLSLCEVGHHCQLGSSLLRKWSPHVRKLVLSDESFEAPGLSAFVEANGSGLRVLNLWCWELRTAALFDHMIPSCSKVTSLVMNGSQVLSLFPTALTHLDITFEFFDGDQGLRWDPSTPSALICRLARHQHLQHISLDFADHSRADLELACPFLVPELQSFSLGLVLDVKTTGVNLSWLHQQPCRKLMVQVHVCTASPEAHRQLIDQVIQAPVSVLTVHWQGPKLPHRLQSMWAELNIIQEVDLRYKGPELFTSARKALQALPDCPRIVIWADFGTRSPARRAFYLSGAAIRSHATKVQLVLRKHMDLHMVGDYPPNLEVLHS